MKYVDNELKHLGKGVVDVANAFIASKPQEDVDDTKYYVVAMCNAYDQVYSASDYGSCEYLRAFLESSYDTMREGMIVSLVKEKVSNIDAAIKFLNEPLPNGFLKEVACTGVPDVVIGKESSGCVFKDYALDAAKFFEVLENDVADIGEFIYEEYLVNPDNYAKIDDNLELKESVRQGVTDWLLSKRANLTKDKYYIAACARERRTELVAR